MKKRTLYIIVILSIIIFTSLIFIRMKQRNAEKEALKGKEAPATAVSVMLPKKGTIAESFATTGVLVAKNQVQVTPKVNGKLILLTVDEGYKISKGQIIGEIEHSELDSQIVQAEAQYKVAKAGLDVLLAGAEDLQIVQAEAGVKQVKENLEQVERNLSQAESDYIRDEKLFEQGAIAESKLDGTRLQRDSLKKQVNAIKQQLISSTASLDLMKRGVRKEEISRAKAQVEQALAGIGVLKTQLENYKIVSPLNGIVTKKNIDLGTLVSPSMSIVTVSQSSNPELEMNIPEKQILKVKLAQKVNIKTDTGYINAIITKISPIVDTQTNLVKVTADVSSDLSLKIGMSFDCSIIINENKNSLIVPSEAIIQDGDNQVVYISINNKAELRKVILGIQTTKEVEIINGITDKDEVIYKGNTFVKQGDRIKVEKDFTI